MGDRSWFHGRASCVFFSITVSWSDGCLGTNLMVNIVQIGDPTAV
jgi:hypothetical protein